MFPSWPLARSSLVICEGKSFVMMLGFRGCKEYPPQQPFMWSLDCWLNWTNQCTYIRQAPQIASATQVFYFDIFSEAGLHLGLPRRINYLLYKSSGSWTTELAAMVYVQTCFVDFKMCLWRCSVSWTILISFQDSLLSSLDCHDWGKNAIMFRLLLLYFSCWNTQKFYRSYFSDVCNIGITIASYRRVPYEPFLGLCIQGLDAPWPILLVILKTVIFKEFWKFNDFLQL